MAYVSDLVPLDVSGNSATRELLEEQSDGLGENFFTDSKHPIYEAELLPVYLSLFFFMPLRRGSQLGGYVDNEPCRLALVRGHSPKWLATCLIEGVIGLEVQLALRPWYGRVPTRQTVQTIPRG